MPKGKKNKDKEKPSDYRILVADKLTRLADRMETLNRKYFAGTQEFLRNGKVQIDACIAGVKALPATWEPKARGKKALIPGAVIRIKSDLDKEEMDTINHLGGAKRFKGAIIVREDDTRTFIVQLADGTKTLVPKRRIELDDAEEEESPAPKKEEKKEKAA